MLANQLQGKPQHPASCIPGGRRSRLSFLVCVASFVELLWFNHVKSKHEGLSTVLPLTAGQEAGASVGVAVAVLFVLRCGLRLALPGRAGPGYPDNRMLSMGLEGFCL
jgi:hypothetical protein